MPNWIDENGFNWFGKLECKRCLKIFKSDKNGEIPIHKCLDGYYKSGTVNDVHHSPIFVKKF